MNSTVSAEVRDYVGQVRAALSDLPVEDVEEFTTGMEADLSERLAEPGDGTLRDRLGEPDAYAAELRSAAGLPPRAAAVEPKKPVGQRISDRWERYSAGVLKEMPWLSDLRPLWWAVRGFALAALPAIVLGAGIVWLGTVGAVASVVIGLLARNGKLTGGWVRPTRVIGNIAAVLLLPFAFILLVDGGDPYANDVYAEPQGDAGLGLINNDGPVMNLYAYDESGRRIDKVRLFDQNGQALTVSEEVFYGSDVDHLRHPNTGEVGVARDVFPVRWDVRTGWERMSKVEWEPPVAITPLPGPVPSVEPTDSASASPSPSASVTRSPVSPQTSPSSGVSATPTPTPSASPSASR